VNLWEKGETEEQIGIEGGGERELILKLNTSQSPAKEELTEFPERSHPLWVDQEGEVEVGRGTRRIV